MSRFPARAASRSGLRGRRRIATSVVAALLLLPTSCSWIFVQKAPPLPVEPTPPVACTSSKAAPVLDTLGAVVLGAAGVVTIVSGVVVGQPCSCPPNQPCWRFLCGAPAGDLASIFGLAAGLIGLATVEGFSAASGYSNTERCREITQAQAACLTGIETACRSLKGEARLAPVEVQVPEAP